MRYACLIAFGVLTATTLPAAAEERAAKERSAGPDCYCTDEIGERREMGEIICINIHGREFLARCEMSLNSPTWRDLRTGCVGA